RVVCRLSRPAYAYLFWVESEGTVRRLRPEAGEPVVPPAAIAWPRAGAEGGGITRAPRPERGVACIVASPLTEAQLKGPGASPSQPTPLPALAPQVVLIDGVPAAPKPGREYRGIGETRPLAGGPLAGRLDALRRGLRRWAGRVSMLAIPHDGGSPQAPR